MTGLHGLISQVSNFTVFALIAFAITSILVFFKVFMSDFNQPD